MTNDKENHEGVGGKVARAGVVAPKSDHISAHGQRLPLPDDQPFVVSTTVSGEVLQAGFSVALAELAAANPKLSVNQVTVASIVSNYNLVNQNYQETQRELLEERDRSREQQSELMRLQSRADIAETRAKAGRGITAMGGVMFTVAGAIIGYLTTLIDKPGSVSVLVLGSAASVALIGVAAFILFTLD